MSEININISELENSITSLSELSTSFSGEDINSPETVGGGATVSELEAIAAQYKEIHNQLNNLISITQVFFENIKNSYLKSDHEIAISWLKE